MNTKQNHSCVINIEDKRIMWKGTKKKKNPQKEINKSHKTNSMGWLKEYHHHSDTNPMRMPSSKIICKQLHSQLQCALELFRCFGVWLVSKLLAHTKRYYYLFDSFEMAKAFIIVNGIDQNEWNHTFTRHTIESSARRKASAGNSGNHFHDRLDKRSSQMANVKILSTEYSLKIWRTKHTHWIHAPFKSLNISHV